MPNSTEDSKRASQWIEFWNDIFESNPDASKNMDSAFCPPEPSPDEQLTDEDPEFLAKCHADVVSMANGPVVWEGQLLTRSPEWGLVWRADFWEVKKANQDNPSRVTCWRRDDGEFGMTISGCQHEKLG